MAELILDKLNEDTIIDPEEYKRELALCEKAGANPEKVKAIGLNLYQLVELRKGLEAKIDVRDFLNPKMPWTEMEELRIERESGIDMSKYRAAGFDVSQLKEIREGLSAGLDVSQYDKKEYFSEQMREIRLGLQSGVPVIFYQDPQFDWMQMTEIRLGLESGRDVTAYGQAEIPYMKMRVVRMAQEDGLTFEGKMIRDYDAGVLEQIRLANLDKIDIMNYVRKRYDAKQLEQVRIALTKKLPDVDKYLIPEIRGESMEEIRIGLEEGLDVSLYANENYNYQQMHELRLGLEHQVDIRLYSKPLYQPAQMRELRLGLEDGLDIAQYSSMVHPAKEMRAMREWLLSGKKLPEDLSILFLGARDADSRRQTPEELAAWKFLETPEGRYIEISEDRMSCYITLPPVFDDAAYTMDYVLTLLFKARVRKGVLRKNIEEMIREKQFGTKVLVAAGKAPVNGVDGYYEYLVGENSNSDPSFDESGSADYSETPFYEEIKMGAKLAVYHKATHGTDGLTVDGQVVFPKSGKEKPILKGSGFMLLNDKVTYVAAIEGVVRYKDGEFHVQRLVKVGPLRSAEDSISVEGSVWVKGDMEDGASVRATGDVLVDGVVTSATIRSGGDILVRQGVTGSGNERSYVEAEGTVSARWFESTDLKCKGFLFTNHLYNCNSTVGQKATLFGEKGAVSGGVLRARLGTEMALLGGKSVVRTVLEIGVGEELNEQYTEITRAIARSQEEMKLLVVQRQKLMDVNDATNKQQLQLKIKVNAGIATKERELAEMTEKKKQIEEEAKLVSSAKVHVTRLAYANSAIMISGATMVLHDHLQAKEDGITFIKSGKVIEMTGGVVVRNV